LLIFACFLVCTDDSSTLAGLFTPVLILSTPAFGATCAVEAFGAAAFSGALAFDAAFVCAEAVFYEVVPTPFGATCAFGAAAFFLPGTFILFPTGPTPASLFLFFAASLLASEPGSRWGP
jgi:hypothetical protein